MPKNVSLRQRFEVDPAEVNLRALGLKQQFAFGESTFGCLVDQLAVDIVGQIAFFDDSLEMRPFGGEALDIFRSAESELVDPIFASAPPIDAARGKGVQLAVGIENVLFFAVLSRFGFD